MKDDRDHLYRCIEAEESIQKRVLELGMKLGDFRRGEGVCAFTALAVIERVVKELANETV
jgi:hypothetical protein